MEFSEMMRGVFSFIIILVSSFLIAYFVTLSGTASALAALVDDPSAAKNVILNVISVLAVPYQYFTHGVYSPLAAYGVAGFIGGLFSKKPAIGMSAAAVVVAIYFGVFMAMVAGLTLHVAGSLAIDFIVALLVAIITAGFGAMFTEK